VAVLVLAVIIGVAYLILRPAGPIIASAEVGSAEISPNADGKNDITTISYSIRRRAQVSIYFEDEAGRRFMFRQDEFRAEGDYAVLFSGIVGGYGDASENIRGNVIQRLIPDGNYKWVIEAADQTGYSETANGTLRVAGSDTVLPDIWEFTISPEQFTPNQDGLADRVFINVFIPKPARLLVYLIDSQGKRYFIPEDDKARKPGQEGRHSFEYDGGVDVGNSPPPDGKYTVWVQAQDEAGQIVERSGEVTIQQGGAPRAEITAQSVGDTVEFSSTSVRIGDVLTFTLTVNNYGNAPIRTTGPEPGFIYNQDQLFSSIGYFVESGAWRVGLHCDTCVTDYPWRWAVGAQNSLTPIEDENGKVHYYLMPGQRSVVTGGVRILNMVPSRNPQQFWAGLIHEDVAIAPLNNRVDPHWIEIVLEDSLLITPTP
jgi:hypothetical protein